MKLSTSAGFELNQRRTTQEQLTHAHTHDKPFSRNGVEPSVVHCTLSESPCDKTPN